jgi:signal peptidase I
LNTHRSQTLIASVVIVLGVFLTALLTYFRLVRIDGDADLPAIASGETIAFRPGMPEKRGEVVLFFVPKGPHVSRGAKLVKRVIGLAGDHIRYEHGRLFLNDQKVIESCCTPFWDRQKEGSSYYSMGPTDYSSSLSNTRDWAFDQITEGAREYVVPKDHIFVIGDNRSRGGSEDSRYFGPVSMSAVIGTGGYVVWPFVKPVIETKATVEGRELIFKSGPMKCCGSKDMNGTIRWGFHALERSTDYDPKQ